MCAIVNRPAAVRLVTVSLYPVVCHCAAALSLEEKG